MRETLTELRRQFLIAASGVSYFAQIPDGQRRRNLSSTVRVSVASLRDISGEKEIEKGNSHVV
jgi:hypothetical protein